MARDAFDKLTNDTPEFPQLRPGLRIFPGSMTEGRYELISLLGVGGMGVVWKAYDHLEQRPCAMKFLPGILLHSEADIARIQAEVNMGKDLRSPRIAATYGLERDQKMMAIIMQLVDADPEVPFSGQSLDKVIEENSFLEPQQIESWVRDVAEALDYIHNEARIFHRDIKPSNVMIDGNGRALLMDFGISSRVKTTLTRLSRTNPNAPQGGKGATLAYASPGQLRGQPHTAADDFYSLGALIYHLLTGEVPFFRGGNEEIIRQQIFHEPITRLNDRRRELMENDHYFTTVGATVPETWERAVAACLAKEPQERVATGAELIGFIEGTRLSIHGKAKRKRMPLWMPVAALVALLAAGGIGWQQMESRKAELLQQEERQKLALISQRVEDAIKSSSSDLNALLQEVRQMRITDERVSLETRIAHAVTARSLAAWITEHEQKADELTSALILEKQRQVDSLPVEFQSKPKTLMAALQNQVKDFEMKGQLETAREFVIKSIQLISSSNDPDAFDKAELARIKKTVGEWPEPSRLPLESKIAELETVVKLAESIRELNRWMDAPVERSLTELKSKEDEINTLPSASQRAGLLSALGKLQVATQMRMDQQKAAEIEAALKKLDEQQRAGALTATAALSQLEGLGKDLQSNLKDAGQSAALNAKLQAESQRYQQLQIADAITQDIQKLGSKPSSKDVSALRKRIEQLTDKKLVASLTGKLPAVASNSGTSTPVKPPTSMTRTGTKETTDIPPPVTPKPSNSWSGTFRDGNRTVTVSGGSVTVLLRMPNGNKISCRGRLTSTGASSATYTATNPLGETVSGSISR
jgi:serine/threonine protein kinase